jgi:hypothetical protein
MRNSLAASEVSALGWMCLQPWFISRTVPKLFEIPLIIYGVLANSVSQKTCRKCLSLIDEKDRLLPLRGRPRPRYLLSVAPVLK